MEADNECAPHSMYRNNSGIGQKQSTRDTTSNEEDDDEDYEESPSNHETAAQPNDNKLQKKKDMYVVQMKKHGFLQGELSQRLALKNHINKKLFTLVKFITHEHQMSFDNVIARRIMNDLDVPEDRRFQYWFTHQSFVTKTLRTKRNNICMTLKDAYISKYYYQ